MFRKSHQARWLLSITYSLDGSCHYGALTEFCSGSCRQGTLPREGAQELLPEEEDEGWFRGGAATAAHHE